MISHALLFFRFVYLDAFSLTLLEFSRLHYCSFFKVLFVVFARALLDYHIAFALSTTFLFFLFCFVTSFGNLFILSHSLYFVNNFFLKKVFLKECFSLFKRSEYHFSFILVDKTEKEGFEPSRRVNDLYP